MQRIGKPVLHLAGARRPVPAIGEPVRPVGHIGPGPGAGDPVRKRLDIAGHTVEMRQLGGNPGFGQSAIALREMAEHPAHQPRMLLLAGLAIIRQATGRPQPRNTARPGCALHHPGLAGQPLEHRHVDGIITAQQLGARRPLVQRADEARQRAEIQLGIAPHQLAQRLEAMLLQTLDLLGREGGGRGRAKLHGAEGAVLLVAPGAAGNLRHLGEHQPAVPPAIELAEAGEGDMGDIHVQPHTDGIGRHQIIDFTGLIHRHLGVAGARREAAHDHCRAALLPAQHLGQRINLGGRESDDGRAARQARELLGAGIAQRREARPRHDLGFGDQLSDQRPDGLRAENHRLGIAARMQQPIGKDMPTLRVRRDLAFIDGDKGHILVHRHRFDGAEEVARLGRHDLLLAGDQRHRLLALERHDTLINLARQQPQWKADDAAGVAAQPLYRKVRLAGVGGAENSRNRAGSGGPARSGEGLGVGPANCHHPNLGKCEPNGNSAFGRSLAREWIPDRRIAFLAT